MLVRVLFVLPKESATLSILQIMNVNCRDVMQQSVNNGPY